MTIFYISVIVVLAAAAVFLFTRKTHLEAELKFTRQQLEDQTTRQEKELTQLSKYFGETMEKVSAQLKNDTSEMLKERQKEFSESSDRNIGLIIKPLRDKLAELSETMAKDGQAQAKRHGEMDATIKLMMEQNEASRKSAEQLAKALKCDGKVQGDWGETVLMQMLSKQGLTEGLHFDTQYTMRDASGKVIHTEEGNSMLRPDVILHLDEVRDVIIDSKVSMKDYMDYVNAESEEERASALRRHIDSVRKHVRELSRKDYSGYVKAPKRSAGYVIMFVPNIGALWAALNTEPSLWQWAAEQNVYIADEQSLYGALKIIEMTWTNIAQVQNQQKVFDAAGDIIDRVGQFVDSYESIGNALKSAGKAFDEGRKKLEPGGQSIITSAKKLMELGAKAKKPRTVSNLKPFMEITDSSSEI